MPRIPTPTDKKESILPLFIHKLPLANASGINHSELCSPSPKLRKPYGWAAMSTST